MERWRNVVGYEGVYDVSDLGRVRNAKSGKIKSPTITPGDKRPYLSLWKSGKCKLSRPHTLVMEAFVGKRPPGMECCHFDGNPGNNRLDNLRWDSPKNNHADKVRHGTAPRGENGPSAKLTQPQVAAIIKDARSQRLIAADYGITQSNVCKIKTGVSWNH